MLIRRLEITGVRNISSASLDDLSSINVLYGVNGAGKTSVLEAIHLLSSAKSFRSHKLKPLINNTMLACISFAEIAIPHLGYQPVGVKRYRSAATAGQIKVAGEAVRSAAVLAENLPLQTISSDTFKLLEGAPAVRRQFLDWGVFHVEHAFHAAWMNTQRCLKQRNTLLRHGRIDDQQLSVWTDELIQLAERLDRYRSDYFNKFVPVFEQTLKKLTQLDGLQITYHRGWDNDKSLADVLLANRAREKELGFTASGPHRADLRLRYQSANAADMLSRGQQKLVVCALRVAQGYLLSELTGRACVFLVDDLPAELDKVHRQALCKLFEELDCQVFITCVDHHDLEDCWSSEENIKLFHVEHGLITAVNS